MPSAAGVLLVRSLPLRRAFLYNYSGGCKAKYHTLLEGVWLSDIGRMAKVRNVPHLARKV